MNMITKNNDAHTAAVKRIAADANLSFDEAHEVLGNAFDKIDEQKQELVTNVAKGDFSDLSV